MIRRSRDVNSVYREPSGGRQAGERTWQPAAPNWAELVGSRNLHGSGARRTGICSMAARVPAELMLELVHAASLQPVFFGSA